MTKVFNRKTRWLCFALLMLLSSIAPAQSRTWSRNPLNLAQDYAIINDNRGNGDLVMIIWIAPPMIAEGPNTQAAKEMLDKYVVLGIAHAHVARDATMTFDQIPTLQAKSADGRALTLLNQQTMPPTVVGTVAAMQSAFARALGALGAGVQWFTFDGGAVHACGKGGMAVPFAGETYTYETPFPGCT